MVGGAYAVARQLGVGRGANGGKKIRNLSQSTDADLSHASGSTGSLKGMIATVCHGVGSGGREGALLEFLNVRLKMPSAAHEMLGF